MATTETVTNAINNAGANLGSKMREAMPRAEKAVNTISYEVGKQAGETLTMISDTATDAYNTSKDYVKENPVKGVAIAATVGLATGCLLTMAFGRKH